MYKDYPTYFFVLNQNCNATPTNKISYMILIHFVIPFSLQFGNEVIS